MKLLKIMLFVLTYVGLTQFTLAAPATDSQLRTLAQVSGVYEQMGEAKKALAQQVGQMTTGLINQTKSLNSNIPLEVQAKFNAAARVQMSKILSYIDVDLIVAKYVELMVPKLSKAEADDVISFFESKVGLKYTEVNTAIIPQLTQFMMADFQPKLMVDMKKFSDTLKQILIESQNQK